MEITSEQIEYVRERTIEDETFTGAFIVERGKEACKSIASMERDGKPLARGAEAPSRNFERAGGPYRAATSHDDTVTLSHARVSFRLERYRHFLLWGLVKLSIGGIGGCEKILKD